jgi:hypothetical protein
LSGNAELKLIGTSIWKVAFIAAKEHIDRKKITPSRKVHRVILGILIKAKLRPLQQNNKFKESSHSTQQSNDKTKKSSSSKETNQQGLPEKPDVKCQENFQRDSQTKRRLPRQVKPSH